MESLGRCPVDPAEPVADHPQPSSGGDLRVLLTEGPGGRVAWVGERRLARLHERRVERLEILDSEEHLAAYLEQVGYRVVVGRRESVRYVVDGLGVERDVLAGTSVAACGAANEDTSLVHQGQGYAVDLQLTQVFQARAGVSLHPRHPAAHLVGIEHVVQRHHSLEMVDGLELGGETAADQLGGRIGDSQLRVLVFEGLQAAQQRVELTVGDDGSVFHVVAELVVTHLLGQLRPLLSGRRRSRLRGRLLTDVCTVGHPSKIVQRADTETGLAGFDASVWTCAVEPPQGSSGRSIAGSPPP